MLQITIPGGELWDEKKEEFVPIKDVTLTLEHSLVSLSKWEAKWCKPFLNKKEEKTTEETIDYIRCMTLTQNVDPSIYTRLSSENIKEIIEYIDNSHSATCIRENKVPGSAPHSNEIVTSELIYYWMVAYNIPFECQKWHLNRLLTLIRICNIKNQPPKKMSQRQLMSRNAALNAARRKQLHTTG